MVSWIALSGPAKHLTAVAGFSFGVQTLAGLVFVPQQNERYFDLLGSIGFLSSTAFSLYYPTLRSRYYLGLKTPFPALTSFHPRSLILSGLTALWAARLGSFLFMRIRKHGKDGRFDEIKKSPVQFFGVWQFQATWVTLTALPVYAVNAIPRHVQPAMAIRDYLAIGAWVGSFLFEVIADRQKSDWRTRKDNKEHDEKFITTGLWSLSRHPNYVGEVGMWASIYLLASRALFRSGAFPTWFAAAAVAGPLFEYGLIRFASGVPMLEEKAEKQFGKDADWQKYKQETPVFFPKVL